MTKADRRYIVETCFTPGDWRPILRTDDYEKAATTTNFWDERQDTRLIDLRDPNPLIQAMNRFDNAIRKLG